MVVLRFSSIFGPTRFWASVNSTRPRRPPSELENEPRGAQDGHRKSPRELIEGSRRPRESLKLAQEGLRRDPRLPERELDGPKTAPRDPPRRTRGPQNDPREPQDDPREPQDGSRGFETAQEDPNGAPKTAPQEDQTSPKTGHLSSTGTPVEATTAICDSFPFSPPPSSSSSLRHHHHHQQQLHHHRRRRCRTFSFHLFPVALIPVILARLLLRNPDIETARK